MTETPVVKTPVRVSEGKFQLSEFAWIRDADGNVLVECLPCEVAHFIANAINKYQAWQPIETAPKDGTDIFVWGDNYRWPEGVRFEPYSTDIAEEAGEVGYWRYSDDLFADVSGSFDIDEATHWKPRPEPPAFSQEESQ